MTKGTAAHLIEAMLMKSAAQKYLADDKFETMWVPRRSYFADGRYEKFEVKSPLREGQRVRSEEAVYS